MTRVMTCGSRKHRDRALIFGALRVLVSVYVPAGEPVELLHGDNGNEDATEGADRICASVAADLGWKATPFPADWFGPCVETCAPGHRKIGRGKSYCPDAGPRRNGDMVKAKPVVCIAFPLPGSSGTWDAVNKAKAAGIPVEIVR